MITFKFMPMTRVPLPQMTQAFVALRGRARLLALVFVLPLVVAAGGCRRDAPEPPPILLQVNNQSITHEEFNRQFEKTLPPGHTLGQDEKDELKRAFLRQVIDRELALSEARRLELSMSADAVEQALAEHRLDYPEGEFEKLLQTQGVSPEKWRRDLEERLLMDKVIAHAVYSQVVVSDEEIAEYYEHHRDEFNRSQQVRARQIVLDSEEQGQDILEQLRSGASFAEMAQLFSLSPDGDRGGDLGFFPRGKMPQEFDDVVFSLPVGQLSDLVQSPYGYHIFLVEENRPAQRLSLDDATPEIITTLQRAKEEQAYQKWLMELGSRAHIDVNWELL
jgi:peptidyl-prolyl cis-trans isomerase C